MALSPQQLEAVDLFAVGGKGCADIAEEIGVTRNTISNWRRSEEFTSACLSRARSLLSLHLPDIYKVLIERAKEGSIHHIRTLLDHLDNLEKVRETSRRGDITFSWNI